MNGITRRTFLTRTGMAGLGLAGTGLRPGLARGVVQPVEEKPDLRLQIAPFRHQVSLHRFVDAIAYNGQVPAAALTAAWLLCGVTASAQGNYRDPGLLLGHRGPA